MPNGLVEVLGWMGDNLGQPPQQIIVSHVAGDGAGFFGETGLPVWVGGVSVWAAGAALVRFQLQAAINAD